MLGLVAALAFGIVIGLARGGSFARLEQVRLKQAKFLVAAVVVQAVATPLQHASRGWVAFWLIMVSYACVAVFAVANAREIGMALVALGSLSNLLVIAVNRGMPVSLSAIGRVGLPDPFNGRTNLLIRGAHRAFTPETKLGFLADIIPLKWASVVSVGDLAIWAGLILLLQALMVGPRGRHRTPEHLDPPAPERKDTHQHVV